MERVEGRGLTMAWNPAQYLQFAGERLRPALDLLARVPLDRPRTIVDLGCGAGNVTKLLGERWPDAHIIGVDNSSEMLEQAGIATDHDSRYQFITADLATWQPEVPVDLVYSNAALQWLPDHAALFPRVVSMVSPGGMAAVQMPDNFHAPSTRRSRRNFCASTRTVWRWPIRHALTGAQCSPSAACSSSPTGKAA
jgi:trans-aconitate 2-methyltransferase